MMGKVGSKDPANAPMLFRLRRAARLQDLLALCGRWWLREFLALFPPAVAQWLVGQGDPVLVIVPGSERIVLRGPGGQVLASRAIEQPDALPATIVDILKANRLAPDKISIGLQLPAEKIFSRSILLPVEARRSIDAIVMQDLLRKTPFKVQDIYCAHVTGAARETSRIAVTQWIVSRPYVADLAGASGLDIARVAFVEADRPSQPGDARPHIELRPNAGRQPSWPRLAAVALCVSAVTLAVAALGQHYWRQQAMLDELDAKLATVRPKAQQVRTAITALERKHAVLTEIRMKKHSLGLLAMWEESTKILPSHTWLTELRLSETQDGNERKITMTGFSGAAAGLVGIIDASPLFTEVALTAPIASDPTEGRERFALQAKLRTHDRLIMVRK